MSWRSAPRRRCVPPRPPPSSTVTGDLLTLPADCLERVLSQLPARALCRSMAVSRSVLLAASASTLWIPICADVWPETFEGQPPSPAWYAPRALLFRGLTLCSTALGGAESTAARRAVLAIGGAWDYSLTNKTTHLLCGAMHVRANSCRPPCAVRRGADAALRCAGCGTTSVYPLLSDRRPSSLLTPQTKKAVAAARARGRVRVVRHEWLRSSVRAAVSLPAGLFIALTRLLTDLLWSRWSRRRDSQRQCSVRRCCTARSYVSAGCPLSCGTTSRKRSSGATARAAHHAANVTPSPTHHVPPTSPDAATQRNPTTSCAHASYADPATLHRCRHGGLFDEFLRAPSSAQPSTHLLTAMRSATASTASDGKLKAARRWGVAVVSIAWLTDAIRDGLPTDPERYAVR